MDRVPPRLFPLSLSGLVSGSILVFMMAIGFFVTPAILGGGRVNAIVMAIQNQVQVLVDLPLAAATSVVLLLTSLTSLTSLLILVVYEKIAGVERISRAASSRIIVGYGRSGWSAARGSGPFVDALADAGGIFASAANRNLFKKDPLNYAPRQPSREKNLMDCGVTWMKSVPGWSMVVLR